MRYNSRHLASRMKRRLLNLLTVLSLLLCVAVVALWLRSHDIRDQLRWGEDRGGYWQINTGRGRVSWIVCRRGFRVPFEWTSGADAAYYPADGLATSGTFQRFKTPPQIYWSQSGRRRSGFGPILIEEGQLGTMWGEWGELLFYMGPVQPYTSVALPMWLLFVLTAVLPVMTGVVALQRLARRVLRRRNCLCPSCGYDLRATPGRCPECGTIAPVPHVE